MALPIFTHTDHVVPVALTDHEPAHAEFVPELIGNLVPHRHRHRHRDPDPP